jgi:hypothetical protein
LLEFQLQGADLAYGGRDFKTPTPKATAPPAIPVAQPAPPVVPAVPVEVPVAETPPSRKLNLLLLIGAFFVFIVPLTLISVTVLFVRMRKRRAKEASETNAKPIATEKVKHEKGRVK